MKKKAIASAALAFALAAFTAVPAFAASVGTSPATVDNDAITADGGYAGTIDVTADITKGATTGTAATEYGATIAWQTTSLAATQAGNAPTYTWDAAAAKYVVKTNGQNTDITTTTEGEAEITVTNRSNAGIQYAISFADQNSFNLTHTASAVAATTLAAADLNGARTAMQAGSTDDTALTGAAVAGTKFTDTLSFANGAQPLLTANAAGTTVCTYTVTITPAS